MKITREADYALRIMAQLAKNDVHMEAKTISEINEVPYRFTLKILRKIVQAGYLVSYRGVNGGYALAKEPKDITLKNIIEVIDGDIALNYCLAGEDCHNKKICGVKKQLGRIQKILSDELNNVTFADIIKE